MEARATLRGPKVSRTLVAGVLVVVALGVGAMGGYVAANLGGGKAASPSHTAAKAIADQSKAVLPDWAVQEITPKTAPRLLQDDIIRNATPALPAATGQVCPAGSHVAVWYTLQATGCVSNIGHSAKADE
jgi:hypothetical protein